METYNFQLQIVIENPFGAVSTVPWDDTSPIMEGIALSDRAIAVQIAKNLARTNEGEVRMSTGNWRTSNGAYFGHKGT